MFLFLQSNALSNRFTMVDFITYNRRICIFVGVPFYLELLLGKLLYPVTLLHNKTKEVFVFCNTCVNACDITILRLPAKSSKVKSPKSKNGKIFQKDPIQI